MRYNIQNDTIHKEKTKASTFYKDAGDQFKQANQPVFPSALVIIVDESTSSVGHLEP